MRKLTGCYRLLGALLLVGWLAGAAPQPAAAAGEVILHISDTHATAASAGQLPAFVATVNTAADGVTLVAHSGDALHDPAGPAPYAVFWTALAGLRVPTAVVPGNHDLDARYDWYRAGYPGTVVAVAGAYTLIGFDARNPDFGYLEDQVRAAAGAGQRVILLTHQPLAIPHTWRTLPCPDGACAAPKWRLCGAEVAPGHGGGGAGARPGGALRCGGDPGRASARDLLPARCRRGLRTYRHG